MSMYGGVSLGGYAKGYKMTPEQRARAAANLAIAREAKKKLAAIKGPKVKKTAAQKREDVLKAIYAADADESDKNLYLRERIFGPAPHVATRGKNKGKQVPAPVGWRKAMTHADKVELSNWLAKKGYGGVALGGEMLSDMDDYELMAGGARARRAPRRRVGRPRKARGGDWKDVLGTALPLALSFL